MKPTPLFCVCCNTEVQAQPIYGWSVYPHRRDLHNLLFYQCPYCGNYVGSHKDGRPLGTIPTPLLRNARHKVHLTIDEYWLPKKNRRKRKELYADLSNFIGREYHTAELNSVTECEKVIEYYNKNYKQCRPR